MGFKLNGFSSEKNIKAPDCANVMEKPDAFTTIKLDLYSVTAVLTAL